MRIANYVICCAVIALSACTEISDGPVTGRLTDKVSGQPIPDAVVLAKWYMGVAGGRYACYHVETARTDADGRYRIPQWSVKLGQDETGEQMRWLPNRTASVSVYALKVGYLDARDGIGGSPGKVDFKATRFAGTEAQWFDEWTKRAGEFDGWCDGGSSRAALDAEAALYERLGSTSKHSEHATFLREKLADPNFEKYGFVNPSTRK